MPIVKGKHYPYTKEGMRMAMDAEKMMLDRKVSANKKKAMVSAMMLDKRVAKEKKKMKGQYYSKREGFGKY